MKKYIYFSLILAVGMSVISCQPKLIGGGEPWPASTSEEVIAGLSYAQYADKECLIPQTDGNYIKYTSTGGTVQWFTLNSDGSENILSTGASGVIYLKPKRGASPQMEAFARMANTDGTMTTISQTFTVFVPGDLDPEYKMLLGESGTKKWIWDFNANTGSTCWGNGGASDGADYNTARTVGGHWWGVALPDSLSSQLSHSGGVATGAESQEAYMVFDEDLNIASYRGDGSIINKGSYSINDYDPERSGGWELASLADNNSAVLFPFSINEGGVKVTDFDLMYLDENHMTLVYTKGNAPGSWGEITHWMFKNASDGAHALAGKSSRKWGWASDGEAIWGNGGAASGAGYKWNVVDGKWWGVTSAADLTGQLSHSDTGVPTGEEDDNAYMIFDTDGKVKSYDAAGQEIRSGTYEINLYPTGRAGDWELGKLTTTAGSILFPFSINEGGVKPTEFDVMYFDADNITLVYTKGNAAGSWGEITYWRFESKD